QRKYISPNMTKLELGHYHGLPKPHKPGTPLRPIVACIHAPVTLVSKFLNDLLAPIYLQIARETTFINGIDVIRKLEKYVKDGHLQSTTKFITVDVNDLYTMIPREGALQVLARFCIKHSQQNRIGTFTIDHIMKMARLILDNNCFAYNNKYYKQTRGGAMGSAFTQVLANIYMYEWEQDLLKHQALNKEIYGRYIDDIFMTTNQHSNEIKIELEKANKKDINIKINYEIDTSVHFLDITVANESNRLRTSIYHKPAAEPYILPYTSDHPRHIPRNIPYTALLRATRICSNVHDFNSECIHIDLSLLLNNYPPKLISKTFFRFFHLNDAIPVLKDLNEEIYDRLHKRLLHQPTRREKQLNMMLQDPIESPTVLQPRIWDNNVMYPRYRYDSSIPIDFPKIFYQWWRTYFANNVSIMKNVKVRLIFVHILMSATPPSNNHSEQISTPITHSNQVRIMSQSSSTSSNVSTPISILPGQILTQSDHEDNLIEGMDELVRNFLSRINQSSPYHTIFRWTTDDQHSLHYNVVIVINEPSHII
ncbi:unnamed protein product, partial [Rotaria sp. Silwood2]